MFNRRQFLQAASAFAAAGVLTRCAAVRPNKSAAESTSPRPPDTPVPVAITGRVRRVMFVHGRAQEGKDPYALKSAWLAALRRGVAANGGFVSDRVEFVFPYYGDTLYRFARAYEIPLSSDSQSRGGPAQGEFLAFQAAFVEDIRRQAGVSDAEIDAQYGANAQERGPLNWAWVQATLRAIDQHAGGMNSKALETFTRDVFLYTTRAGVRDEIDAIVAAGLTEEPTAVVSHSLGTVVAYNVLKNDRRRLRIPLLVTLGSPLGVRAIRDQLRPIRRPAGVDAWLNAFDPTDVVALYPLDDTNFPVSPAIANHGHVKNHTDNRHGIDGYLDDPLVARTLLATFAA